MCDDTIKTIFINSELHEKYIEKVLCHELTHAAMFSYNIELTLEQEEILADLIATYGQEIVYITNLVFKRIIEKREGTSLYFFFSRTLIFVSWFVCCFLLQP